MTKYLRTLIIVTVVTLAVTACGDDDLGGLGGDTSADPSGFEDQGFGDGDATLPTAVGNIPGGLGIQLIHEVFDEVDFCPGEGGGNCVTMKLKRSK